MGFCPKCGKKGIKGVFCKECAELEIDLDFKDIVIKHCVECGKLHLSNKWVHVDMKEGLIKGANAKIRNPANREVEIIPVFEELDKPGLKQQIQFKISVNLNSGWQNFEIPAIIDNTYCEKCAKKDTQYFEGVLQLRNATKELIKYVQNDIKDHEKKGVFLVKEKIKGDSADFILTSNKYIRNVARRIKARFNGELSENAKLFSRNKQTSKEIFRLNVLFKMRKFKVGDTVEFRGKKVKIKTVGKNVSGIDVETGKKVFVDL